MGFWEGAPTSLYRFSILDSSLFAQNYVAFLGLSTMLKSVYQLYVCFHILLNIYITSIIFNYVGVLLNIYIEYRVVQA